MLLSCGKELTNSGAPTTADGSGVQGCSVCWTQFWSPLPPFFLSLNPFFSLDHTHKDPSKGLSCILSGLGHAAGVEL